VNVDALVECQDGNLNDLLAVTAQVSSLLVMNAKAEMHDSSSIGVTLPTDGIDYRDCPTFQDLGALMLGEEKWPEGGGGQAPGFRLQTSGDSRGRSQRRRDAEGK
jgi:hypothetical protein